MIDADPGLVKIIERTDVSYSRFLDQPLDFINSSGSLERKKHAIFFENKLVVEDITILKNPIFYSNHIGIVYEGKDNSQNLSFFALNGEKSKADFKFFNVLEFFEQDSKLVIKSKSSNEIQKYSTIDEKFKLTKGPKHDPKSEISDIKVFEDGFRYKIKINNKYSVVTSNSHPSFSGLYDDVTIINGLDQFAYIARNSEKEFIGIGYIKGKDYERIKSLNIIDNDLYIVARSNGKEKLLRVDYTNNSVTAHELCSAKKLSPVYNANGTPFCLSKNSNDSFNVLYGDSVSKAFSGFKEKKYHRLIESDDFSEYEKINCVGGKPLLHVKEDFLIGGRFSSHVYGSEKISNSQAKKIK